ncbi:MAG: hypothetical protein GY856_12655 [bacterium]|nr:hypothetical protein [bacterium]
MVDESMIATGKPSEICVDERHITSPIGRFVAEKIPEIEDQLAAQGCSAVPAADYRLLACDDDEAIERTYRETTFRIVALTPAGLLSPQPRLLALPAEQFCFTQHKVPRWR